MGNGCLKWREPAAMPIRLVAATFAATALFVAPALAQVPAPKAKAPSSAPSAPVQTGPPATLAPEPTFDEGTAQRISSAMLSYSALEVRGGWPTLPAGARLVPGAKGPDVALLRERLVITDDLAPEHARGETY